MSSGRGIISHEQVALMMPAFIRGKLDTEQQRRIQEHIANCSVCAMRHREDLELAEAIASTPAEIELLLTSGRRERNRQQLLAGLTLAGPAPELPPSEEAQHRPPARMAALAAAVAAVALGTVLLTQSLVSPEGNVPVTYRTQTTDSPQLTPATVGPTYKVVFRSGATLDSVQQLLLHSGAVVVGGPTESGVYTLAFPAAKGNPDAILSHLRNQPEIVFAERSVYGNG